MSVVQLAPAPRYEPAFYWPRDDERVAIVGQNGSGKTQCGFWLLAHASFDRRPWIFIDTKREILVRKLERMGAIRDRLHVGSSAPKHPGIYVLRADETDDDGLDAFLWRVKRRGRTGIFIDEGHAVAPPGRRGSALRSILTQGRSLRLPVISLSQQPSNVDTYIKSEAQHIVLFYLVDRDDRREMRRFMPIDPDVVLPRYWAYWYNAKLNFTWRLPPVPDADTILNRIAERAPRSFWRS